MAEMQVYLNETSELESLLYPSAITEVYLISVAELESLLNL